MPSFADYVQAFQQGLGVLADDPLSAPGKLYDATGQNLRTGLNTLGVGMGAPGQTRSALTSLGVNPDLAAGIEGAGATLRDDFLNPLSVVGGTAAAPVISAAVGRAAAYPAVQRFIGSEAGRSPQYIAPSAAAIRLPQIVGADKATTAISNPSGGIDPSLLPVRQRLLASPDYPQYMTGVDPGSRYLGAGNEAVTLRSPAGEVQRIGFAKGLRNPTAPPPAIDIPEMLPTTASKVYGTTRVDRMPFAQVGKSGDPASEAAANRLQQAILGRGYDPWDVYPQNIGWVGDRAYVIDRGAVLPPGQAPPR